jgi:hypothetical protein
MTTPVSESVGQAYLAEARRRLAACHTRIRHCLDQLDDAQVWWRPRPSMNSVANLVLHLCGNLRQWIVSGVGGAPDVRDRPAEFAEREGIPKAELLHRLDEVVREADAELAGLAEARLLDPRRIQGFDETVLSAIFDSLSHLAGHTQEIVHLTRLQLGETYVFAWTPATPEQGAPAEPLSKQVADATDAVFEEGPAVLPDPVLPHEVPAAELPAVPAGDDGGTRPDRAAASPTADLGDYVREIGEEFQEEEDEGKI